MTYISHDIFEIITPYAFKLQKLEQKTTMIYTFNNCFENVEDVSIL